MRDAPLFYPFPQKSLRLPLSIRLNISTLLAPSPERQPPPPRTSKIKKEKAGIHTVNGV